LKGEDKPVIGQLVSRPWDNDEYYERFYRRGERLLAFDVTGQQEVPELDRQYMVMDRSGNFEYHSIWAGIWPYFSNRYGIWWQREKIENYFEALDIIHLMGGCPWEILFQFLRLINQGVTPKWYWGPFREYLILNIPGTIRHNKKAAQSARADSVVLAGIYLNVISLLSF